MSGRMPLLANIKIDDTDKLELFRTTIADASKIFEEAHIKIRGRLAADAIKAVKGAGFKKLTLHQQLREEDWVSATNEMLDHIGSRSVFLFVEDHRLLADLDTIRSVLSQFDELGLNYLVYSWFRASNFRAKNALPFYSAESSQIVSVDFDSKTLPLLGKISPRYHTFTIVAIVSTDYFRSLLAQENKRFKLYSKILTGLLCRLFPYPGYRKVFNNINAWLKHLNIRLCIYHPSAPFNLERMWWEFIPFNDTFKVGVSKKELFANFDDDNGADGESLIKRGLYPFSFNADAIPAAMAKRPVRKEIRLMQGQRFHTTYHSAVGRVSKPPILRIEVKSGQVNLYHSGQVSLINQGGSRTFHSNKTATLEATRKSTLEIAIYDEIF